MKPANANELLDSLAALVAERMPTREVAPEYAPEEDVLTVFGTRTRARRAIRSGSVTGSIVGRRIVIARAELARYVAEHAPAKRLKVEGDQEPSLEEMAEASGLRLAPRRRAS